MQDRRGDNYVVPSVDDVVFVRSVDSPGGVPDHYGGDRRRYVSHCAEYAEADRHPADRPASASRAGSLNPDGTPLPRDARPCHLRGADEPCSFIRPFFSNQKAGVAPRTTRLFCFFISFKN